MTRRLLARIRHTFPLSVVVPWVVLGQLASLSVQIWMGDYAMLLVLAAALAVSMRSPRAVSVLSLMIGALSALHLRPEPAVLSAERSYVARLAAAPERPRVGEVKLQLMIDFELAPSGEARGLDKKVRAICRAVDLPWRNAAHLQPGDTFVVRGTFRPIRMTNLVSYDAMLARHGFTHACKIRYASATLARSADFLAQLRQRLRRFVFSKLGEGESAGLLLAMSIGTRNLISEESEHAFKRTGLAHLLVASGYQVMLVFSLLTAGLRLMAGSLPVLHAHVWVRSAASLAGLAGCLAFVALVGSEASILRALFAAVFLVVGAVFERGGHMFNGVLLSFFIMALAWPGCYLEPGVQLTFAALSGLSLGSHGEPGMLRYLRACVLACLATSAVTTAWFGSFSLWTFLLNPVLAPLGSLLGCAGGLCAMALCWSGLDAAGIALKLVSAGLECFRDGILLLAQVEGMSYSFEGKWRWICAAAFASAFLLLSARRLRMFEKAYSLNAAATGKCRALAYP